MFWSTETLKKKLPNLISDFRPDKVKQANYTLCVGPQVYVSPTSKARCATDRVTINLEPEDQFRIPSGQFAFLLTEECVEVPSNAIAFISIRARYKFKGLVNVSGFHVDPGYCGKLLFAVFNAAPSDIVLERGEECFHIWYASLDSESEDLVNDGQLSHDGRKQGYDHIPSKVVGDMGEQLVSLKGLDNKLKRIEIVLLVLVPVILAAAFKYFFQ